MKSWLKAFRLRTLPLSFSTILTGNAVAYYSLNSSEKADNFQIDILILTLLTTLFLQVLSNLANDYGDAKKGADNENRIGPQRAIQSGEISAKSMLIAIIICSILALSSGLLLLFVAFKSEINVLFLSFFIIGILSIAAAIKYTVGKGAYGYSGLGDVFVFIFFGIVGVAGSYYLQTKELNYLIFLPATTIGCLSAAVLNLNNMRDIENDRTVGKNTLVVKIGALAAKKYHYALFIAAWASLLLFYIFLSYYKIITPIILLPLVMHIIHILKVIKIHDPKKFDPELKKVAISTFVLALLIGVTFIT